MIINQLSFMNNQPFKIKVEAGKKYSWCSCGYSKNQPVCDGAHKKHTNADGSPVSKSVAYSAEKDQDVYFCGCKKTSNGVFCDGSHNS